MAPSKKALQEAKNRQNRRSKIMSGAAGVAAGLGGYMLLRRRRPEALGTPLRALQDAVGNKRFEMATDATTPWIQRARSAIFGAKNVSKGERKGAVVLQHTGDPGRAKGDVNINLSPQVWETMGDKQRFGEALNQVAPDAHPRTRNLADAMREAGGDFGKLRRQYQDTDAVVKPREGSLGRGVKTSLDDEGVKGIASSENAAKAHVIQDKMKIKREYRVHVVDGKAFSTSHRRIPNRFMRKAWDRITGSKTEGGSFVPVLGKNRKRLNQFSEGVTSKVYGDYKHGNPVDYGASHHLAYDVAELDDGTLKMIEANVVPGSTQNPFVSRKLQRMVTGRWGKDVAGAGGLAAGSMTAGGTRAVTKPREQKK